MAEPDIDKDAHLLAALRNAPDHDVAPPAQLKRSIFEDARRAVRPSTRMGAWAWPAWLRQPAGAAAFASVMMAGVIGLMWRDGPPPETQVVAELPARETADTSKAAPAVEPAVKPTVAPNIAIADNTLPSLPTLPSAPSAKARLPERPAPAAAPAIVAVPAAPTLVPPPAPPFIAVLETRRGAPAVSRMEAAPAAAPPPRVVMPDTAATATAADPLAEVISSLAAGSETLALLLDVQARAQGLWVAQHATSPPPGTAVLDAQGRLLGHFSLQGRVARWQGAQASAQAPAQAWRAVLPTATKAPE